MATLTKITTKPNASDPWIDANTDTHVTDEQRETVLKPFWDGFMALPGFQSANITYSEDGLTSTSTIVFDTPERLKIAMDYWKTSRLGVQRIALLKQLYSDLGLTPYPFEQTIT